MNQDPITQARDLLSQHQEITFSLAVLKEYNKKGSMQYLETVARRHHLVQQIMRLIPHYHHDQVKNIMDETNFPIMPHLELDHLKVDGVRLRILDEARHDQYRGDIYTCSLWKWEEERGVYMLVDINEYTERKIRMFYAPVKPK